MALGYFDKLLRKVTDEELQAIDEFVAENDSFTVFTNLSRRVESRPNSLTQQQNSLDDDFARRGLPWVMALARIEYASILAAFTTTPNPFVSIRPSAHELSAYKSLLLDGGRMHYWSLSKDPVVKKITNTSPQNPIVLSYSRRLGLARKMLKAVAKAGIGELSPQQYRELASWKRDLDGLHAGIHLVIQSYLVSVQARSTSTTTNREEREFLQACNVQLQAERRELSAGTARVYDLQK